MFKRFILPLLLALALVCALPTVYQAGSTLPKDGTWKEISSNGSVMHVFVDSAGNPMDQYTHAPGAGAQWGCKYCLAAAVTIVKSYVAREASCGDPGDFVKEMSDGTVEHQQVNSLVPKQHDYYPLDATDEGKYYHGCKNVYVKTAGGQAEQCGLREECAFGAWQVSADGSKETCTCAKCGRVLTRAHTYGPSGVAQSGDNAGKYVHKCSTCGREEPCVFENWTVTKQPTCGEAGERTATCKICGQTATQAIPATGKHTKITYKGLNSKGQPYHGCENCAALDAPCDMEIDTKNSYDATCTKAGKRVKKCSVCGKTLSVDIVPLGHNYAIDKTSAASDDNGVYCIEKCTRCGDTQKLGIDGISVAYDSTKSAFINGTINKSAFTVQLYRGDYLLATIDLNNKFIGYNVDSDKRTLSANYTGGYTSSNYSTTISLPDTAFGGNNANIHLGALTNEFGQLIFPAGYYRLLCMQNTLPASCHVMMVGNQPTNALSAHQATVGSIWSSSAASYAGTFAVLPNADGSGATLSITTWSNAYDTTAVNGGILFGTAASNDKQLTGGAGNDIIASNLGDTTFNGGVGNDILFVGAGNDVLCINDALSDSANSAQGLTLVASPNNVTLKLNGVAVSITGRDVASLGGSAIGLGSADMATMRKGLRLDALTIRTNGENGGYAITYRVHAQNVGWANAAVQQAPAIQNTTATAQQAPAIDNANAAAQQAPTIDNANAAAQQAPAIQNTTATATKAGQ